MYLILDGVLCRGSLETVSKVSSRIGNRCETKTKDNVFVMVVASIQYRAMEDKACNAYYKLSNPKAQIQSYVLDATVPGLELDDTFEQKK